MTFSKRILRWYKKNRRKLPWRESKEPYRIWLSEVILQQTRVDQGMPYYQRFVDKYPTVQDLAAAREEEILKLWQGLGYYSRARNLHAAAISVVNDHSGEFPDSYDDLLGLKGIGDYTASAIASISFGHQEAVVDGNVYRVLSRYYGVTTPIDTYKGKAYFKELATEIIDREEPGNFNQGLMELGATVCKPRNPECDKCPLNTGCVAFELGEVQKFPVRSTRKRIRERYFNYLVILDPLRNTKMIRRTGKGIWQHLYEFPLYESKGPVEADDVKGFPGLQDLVQGGFKIRRSATQPILHKLSHQHLHLTFWIVSCEQEQSDGLTAEEMEDLPVPAPIADFIRRLKISYF